MPRMRRIALPCSVRRLARLRRAARRRRPRSDRRTQASARSRAQRRSRCRRKRDHARCRSTRSAATSRSTTRCKAGLRRSGRRQEADAVGDPRPAARPRSAQRLPRQGRRATPSTNRPAAPTTASAWKLQQLPDGTLQGHRADRRHARPRARASSPATSSSPIDGKPIDAGTMPTATEPLRGEPGSKVVLTIVREGTPKPFDVTLHARDHPRRQRALRACSNPATATSASPPSRPTPPPISQRTLDTPAGAGRRQAARPGDRPAQQSRAACSPRRCRSPTTCSTTGKIVSTRGRIAISDARIRRDPGRSPATARRSWCWSTPVRPAPRKCSPARCATTSARAWSAAAPSARARCRPCCRWTTATRSSSPPRAITRPAASRSRRAGIEPDVVLHPDKGGERRPAPITAEATLPGHLRGDEEGDGREPTPATCSTAMRRSRRRWRN